MLGTMQRWLQSAPFSWNIAPPGGGVGATVVSSRALNAWLLLQEHYARQQKYMAGSMLTEAEDEDVPLLYFNNPLKFLKWVSSWAIPG